jgi:hypothetical protein
MRDFEIGELIRGLSIDMEDRPRPFKFIPSLECITKPSVRSKVLHEIFGSGCMSSFLRKAMLGARNHSIAGSLSYYFMDWRHMTQIPFAGQEVYTELLNL